MHIVYQSVSHNVIMFSSLYLPEGYEKIESAFADLFFMKNRIDKDLNQAKLILANNDCDHTVINGLVYRGGPLYPDGFYSVEYSVLELAIDLERSETDVSLWMNLPDGFQVFSSLSLTFVGDQAILHEKHT